MNMRLPLVGFAALVGLGSLGFAAYAEESTGTPPEQAQEGPHHFVPSPADRAAFMDARLAALRAGLELTPDQEKLWPPVDAAFRDLFKTFADEREKARSEGRPADPIARLQRVSENEITRGQDLKKLADAAAPLYAALTDDQKKRLPILLHAAHLFPWHRHLAMGEEWRGHEGGPGGDLDRGDRPDHEDEDQR